MILGNDVEEIRHTNNLQIRLAISEDLDAIFKIENECFAIPWSLESIENDLNQNPSATLMVAVLNEEVIGYIGMWTVLDEAQITNLAVSKASRGKGIGKMLLSRLCQNAKELGTVILTLEVRPSNISAITVYKGAGFNEISRRKSYYKNNGEDAIIMLKNIGQDVDGVV